MSELSDNGSGEYALRIAYDTNLEVHLTARPRVNVDILKNNILL